MKITKRPILYYEEEDDIGYLVCGKCTSDLFMTVDGDIPCLIYRHGRYKCQFCYSIYSIERLCKWTKFTGTVDGNTLEKQTGLLKSLLHCIVQSTLIEMD